MSPGAEDINAPGPADGALKNSGSLENSGPLPPVRIVVGDKREVIVRPEGTICVVDERGERPLRPSERPFPFLVSGLRALRTKEAKLSKQLKELKAAAGDRGEGGAVPIGGGGRDQGGADWEAALFAEHERKKRKIAAKYLALIEEKQKRAAAGEALSPGTTVAVQGGDLFPQAQRQLFFPTPERQQVAGNGIVVPDQGRAVGAASVSEKKGEEGRVERERRGRPPGHGAAFAFNAIQPRGAGADLSQLELELDAEKLVEEVAVRKHWMEREFVSVEAGAPGAAASSSAGTHQAGAAASSSAGTHGAAASSSAGTHQAGGGAGAYDMFLAAPRKTKKSKPDVIKPAKKGAKAGAGPNKQRRAHQPGLAHDDLGLGDARFFEEDDDLPDAMELETGGRGGPPADDADDNFMAEGHDNHGIDLDSDDDFFACLKDSDDEKSPKKPATLDLWKREGNGSGGATGAAGFGHEGGRGASAGAPAPAVTKKRKRASSEDIAAQMFDTSSEEE